MIPVGNFSRFFLYHGRRDGNEEGEEAANGGDDPENLQARTDTPAVGSPSNQGRNQAAYTGTETQGHAGSKTNVAGKVSLSQDDHGTVRRKKGKSRRHQKQGCCHLARTVCEKVEGGDHDEEGYPHDLDVSHFVCQDTAQKSHDNPHGKKQGKGKTAAAC